MLNKYFKLAVIAASIFAVTYAFATTMNITGVGFLAGGEVGVVSPANVNNVDWILARVGNRWMVVGTNLSFDGNLTTGTTIYVELYDKSGTVISSGSQILTSELPANTFILVNVSPNVRANDIDSISVTIVG
jgi:hypothetical protein